MNGKHAYLIMAHQNNFTFTTLLHMLDHEKNDIFIHFDAKTKDYDSSAIKKLLTKSKVYHTERTKVTWGGYSQINAELLLLDLAKETDRYDYYHLLSGQDLPIKSQKYIHEYFSINTGKEFLDSGDLNSDKCWLRVEKYHFLQEYIGRKSKRNPIVFFLKIVKEIIMFTQKLLKIKRNKNVSFKMGANWFSITDDLAGYVITKKEWIKKIFSNTRCADEIFIQTIVDNSPYKEKLHNNMRLIDWKRGSPYTFKIEDYDLIMRSDMLFARKFSVDADKKIIELIKKAQK